MSEEIEDHRLFNHSENEPFSSVLERRIARRSVLRGGLGVAAATMLGGFGLAGCSSDSDGDDDDGDMAAAMMLAFEAIAGSQQDAVVVPGATAQDDAAVGAGMAAAVAASGYTAQVVVPWGTPITSDGAPWRADLAFTPSIQENAVGMHHDGMWHFPISEETASSNFIFALNNEYIDQLALFATNPGGLPTGYARDADGNVDYQGGGRDADEVRTEINAHGVTIVELRRGDDGQWSHVMDSTYNRRFTSATPMNLSGPVAGSDYVKTAYSPTGTETRGTNNNCANGYTPWGTYLTCEENWPNVFRKDEGRENDDNRLGIPSGGTRYYWEAPAGDASEVDGEFARFNATPSADDATGDYRNEPRTFGYIVEIDPYTNTRAVKRTALGRFRHEGCWVGKLVEGEPVVFYSGHDSRNEYIYKYVSDAMWDPSDANRTDMTRSDRLAIGDKYMDSGTLYAARFNADGSGAWLPLTPETMVPDGSQTLAAALGLEPGDLAGVIINTCDAADIMGATPMDRPEWGAVDPTSGEVYMTLTNNSDRTAEGTDPTYTNGGTSDDELGVGFSKAPVNAANPRPNNSDGQVIRWREPTPGETTFDWEIFVFGKVPSTDDENISGLSDQNYFSSCDGLWYDDRGDGNGILWIETDTGGTDYTNDQVLAVVPQGLNKGDSGAVVNESNQSQLKRFAVGPNGCEVTGIFATPDRTALFINIQHPSNWPADDSVNEQDATAVTSGEVRPRASTVVIQKSDGGQIAV
ncbi:PhoX family phosphatase [Endozoicomonas sp. G2_2]|uniref:PhoX family protein n=1 Tax=Endozoicomonas sp. G2_2 TaxID=2821092 RepID=UPI001ADB5BF0|nr:PhoX family phosphatase [Endozoicomonas sp. G2_2]MBO9469973.1 PhoX family phosphatase [Endozoicomonas sp. G2_2]